MEVVISKEDLLKGIQTVQGAVSSKNTLPILNNILIETQNDQVKLTATDLDIAITAYIPAQIKTAGNITVPAKRFNDIIKELRSTDSILIQVKKNSSVTIESGKAVLKLIGLR